jgi:hypothetical protein
MRASYTATSAATAAKDSWKLAPRIASGSIAITISAAIARLRIVSEGRSNMTADSMTQVIISARSVPTRDPVAMS